MDKLHIRFNIAAFENKGNYGAACYEFVFTYVPARMLHGCVVSMGDSRATLAGGENVCIIGLTGPVEQLRSIMEVLSQTPSFQSVCASNPLVLNGSEEPLVVDGVYTEDGNQLKALAKLAFDISSSSQKNVAQEVPANIRSALKTEQPKRNWKIWALVAALVIVGGGYFANKMYVEKQLIANIEQTLANLPGGFVLKAENIAVNSLSKSAVLTKVTGSGKINGETVTVSVDSAEGKGINVRAFEEKGVTSLGDSLTLHNVKIAGSGVAVSMDLYQLEKVQGDFAAISEQSSKLWAIAKAGVAADAAKDNAGSKKAEADLLAAIHDGALDALATLRIGKVRVEKYVLTATNVGSAANADSAKLTISVGSVEGNGINLRATEGKGVANLCDSMLLRNFKIAAPGLDASIDLYQLEKVQGDFLAIAKQNIKLWDTVKTGIAADAAKDKAASKKAEAAMLAAIYDGALDALETLHIDKARMEKYSLTFGAPLIKDPEVDKLTLRMDSAEGTDYSITHYGPMFGRGLAVEKNDKPLASLEEISVKSMDMPPYKELVKLDAEPDPSLKNLKMSIQDLRLKKLDITLPMEEQAKISLDDCNFSFSLDKGSGALGLKVGALDMPTTLLVRENPQGSALLTQGLLPPRILLNKDVDIIVAGKDNDVFDMQVKANASVKDLGAVAFSGDLLNLAVSSRTEPLLRKLDIAVTDGGFMKTVLATKAMMSGKGGTPEAVRADLVAQVEAARETLPHQSLKDVATALAKFLKQPGGTMHMALAPEKPVPLNAASLAMVGDAAKLGISSSFTPGK